MNYPIREAKMLWRQISQPVNTKEKLDQLKKYNIDAKCNHQPKCMKTYNKSTA